MKRSDVYRWEVWLIVAKFTARTVHAVESSKYTADKGDDVTIPLSGAGPGGWCTMPQQPNGTAPQRAPHRIDAAEEQRPLHSKPAQHPGDRDGILGQTPTTL